MVETHIEEQPEGDSTAISDQFSGKPLKEISTDVLLNMFLESSPDGILVVDASARLLLCNRRFREIFDIPAELVSTGDDEPVLRTVTSRMRDPIGFVKRVQYLYDHPDDMSHEELELMNGRIIDRHSSVLGDGGGRYLGRAWFFRDVTERKAAERKIRELARTDGLTGLANRGTFIERLGLACAEAHRSEGRFGVFYLDLDHFKDVNDTLGHPVGDALLKIIGTRLIENVRGTDLVARFGGDEFAILQTDLSDLSSAGTLASRLESAIAAPCSIEGNDVRVTASIGIASYLTGAEGPEDILKRADVALYRAKEEGRNQYRFHSRELDDLVSERIHLADELRLAIERDELELYYQPEIAIASGEIVGMEALVRWNHPVRGVLLPAAFLAAAERCGAIVPLGHWVLNTACRQFKRWRDEGIAPVKLTVNLSATQLKVGQQFDRDVEETLGKWKISPSELQFDVTEAVLMETSRRNADAIPRLSDLGVGIAIDDFGTETTSIGLLKALKVTCIKIAPEFIASTIRSPEDAVIVRKIIELAHELGIEIIAEGVENEAQRASLLSANEATTAQGWYFSKALPRDEAAKLLRQYQQGVGSVPSRPIHLLERR